MSGVVTFYAMGAVSSITALMSDAVVVSLIGLEMTNPVGWGVLIATAGIAITSGVSIKVFLKEKLPSWDLPVLVRKFVNEDSLYKNIDGKKEDIKREILKQMKQHNEFEDELIKKTVALFEDSLEKAAEDARMLII